MCGILCCIYKKIHTNKVFETNKWDTLKKQIARRGPDGLSTSQLTNDHWSADFVASILWMQGYRPTIQPCVDDEGNILLWNGDIMMGEIRETCDSDTLELLKNLKTQTDVYKTLSNIKGPYSFIYYQKKTNTLFFGRDPIGRHSLLINLHIEDEIPFLTLSSTAHNSIKNIKELPAIGIFSIDLNDSKLNLSCSPWYHPDDHFYLMVNNLNFSIDITINQPIRPIELVSIGDASSSKIDPKPYNFMDIVNTIDCKGEQIFQNLLKNESVSTKVQNSWKLINESLRHRIMRKPKFCQDCMKQIIVPDSTINEEFIKLNKCQHSKIGILFSGGLDSTLLAAISHNIIHEDDTIDLINVAFEVTSNQDQSPSSKFNVPDRQTGYSAYKELQDRFPLRKWNFVEVNVTREELQECCSKHICHLIYPLNTVLDESLGCALWFASRGSGILSSTKEPYTSPCRVLLTGIEADELFGGYTRHRTILRRSGWDALTKELDGEMLRISARNLGRDDRIIADHGRQGRFPFLYDDLVQEIQSYKAWERCCPIDKLPFGIGDKLLLRLVAYFLRLNEVALRPKRAFQFGSRIANSKQNAQDVSQWLK